MLGEDIAVKLRRLDEARRERDETKAAAESAEKTYRALEGEVWDELEEASIEPPFKLRIGDEVVTFSPAETIYGRVQDAEKARAWLVEEGEEDVFLKEHRDFVPRRVNELVRERIEQRKPLPPGIDFSPRRYISISRQEA